MNKAIHEHIRSNVVGYIAIFMFAMGGTAYATHPGGANTISAGDIQNDQVYSADVRDDTLSGGGLTQADLAPASVRTSEIGFNSIQAQDIGVDQVEDFNLAPNSVRSSEIASDAVGSSEIAPDSVGIGEIVDNGVRSAEIAQEAVGLSETGPNSVGLNEIVDSGVYSPEIGDGAIKAAEIGTIHERPGSPVSIPGGGAPQNGAYDTAGASAQCFPNELLISGSARWSQVGTDAEQWIQSIDLDYSTVTHRVFVSGGNDSGTTRSLIAVAYCLEV